MRLGGLHCPYAARTGDHEISNPEAPDQERLRLWWTPGPHIHSSPARCCESWGLRPTRASEFQLASGETAQYARGEAIIRINSFAQVTPVVFGDDDAEPLIGVVTLEQLELAVDPVAGAFIPTRPRL